MENVEKVSQDGLIQIKLSTSLSLKLSSKCRFLVADGTKRFRTSINRRTISESLTEERRAAMNDWRVESSGQTLKNNLFPEFLPGWWLACDLWFAVVQVTY